MRTLERLVYTKKGFVIADTLEGDVMFAPKELRGLRFRSASLWKKNLKR